MNVLTHNDIKTFIKSKLKAKLTNDFCRKPFRIFRERDLHACAYYHLRRYLDGDHRWVILNEPNLRNLKGSGRSARPDILIQFVKRKSATPIPKILIELKFRKRNTGSTKKDTKVLRRSVDKKWVKKAFYIETVVRPGHNKQPVTRKYRNKVITIPMLPARLEDYKKKLSVFRAPVKHRRKKRKTRR